MLSRVAENLYWFSRYVRRTENLARLLNVSSQLQLDLPRAAHFAWRPLVDTLGAGPAFERWSAVDAIADEAAVVQFLLTAPDNPTALQVGVGGAREMLRTVRETLPQDCWGAINDLHLYVEAEAERACARRHRQVFLDQVIDRCLRVFALLNSNVSRDIGFHFLRLGAAIEQADMTSRIIDTAAAGLIQARSADDLEAFRAMQWMSVLQSLAAYQMYRRQLRQRVSVERALQFLLLDREFPRSILFCLGRIQRLLPKMPLRQPVQLAFQPALGMVFDADPARLAASGPGEFVDTFQLRLANLHGAIEGSYFRSI